MDLSVDQGHQSFLSQLNGVFQSTGRILTGFGKNAPLI
ncbi:hypothetical protein RBRAMI_3568 [Pseudomonas aeruginosa RB]|nr:hypothetical protein RBRAMI_3568 [Pseudomonas aeruginosa RB]